MMPDREIIYSTKPYTLGELVLLQGAGQSNWTNMACFFKLRSDLTDEEIYEIDEFELPVVIEKIAKAHEAAIILHVIGSSL